MTPQNGPSEMPKATTPVGERQGRRHNPLEADILGGSGILRSEKTSKKTKQEKEEDHFVNSKQSARILQLGRELADEDDDQNKPAAESRKSAFEVDSRFAQDDDKDDNRFDDDEAWGEEDEIELEGAEIAPEDLAMFNKFLTADEDPLLKHGWDRKPADGEEQQGGTNLADLIMEKIQAFEASGGDQQEMGGMEDFPEEDLHPKVIEVYAKCVICPFDRTL
jgi:essential nuclear protein 1